MIKKLINICIYLVLFSSGVVAQTFPKDSIYSVKMKWKNEQGQSFNLDQLAGNFVVTTMAYTTCRSACPLTMQRLKAIKKDLSPKDQVKFLVISFDPEVDQAKELKMFKNMHKLDSNWILIIGSAEETRKISLLLGMNYQKNTDSKDIMHSNKIVLLDPRGRIVEEVEGLTTPVNSLVEKIKTPAE